VAIAEAAASKAEAKYDYDYDYADGGYSEASAPLAWINVGVDHNGDDSYNNVEDSVKAVATSTTNCPTGTTAEDKFEADIYGQFVMKTTCVSSSETHINVVEETTITEHSQTVTFGSQSWKIHFCKKGDKIVQCQNKHFAKGAFDITNAKMFLSNFFTNYHGSYTSRVAILRKFLSVLKSQTTVTTVITTQITEIEGLITKYKNIIHIRREKARALKLKKIEEAKKRAALAEKKREEEEARRLAIEEAKKVAARAEAERKAKEAARKKRLEEERRQKALAEQMRREA
jgi:hypothetical protein